MRVPSGERCAWASKSVVCVIAAPRAAVCAAGAAMSKAMPSTRPGSRSSSGLTRGDQDGRPVRGPDRLLERLDTGASRRQARLARAIGAPSSRCRSASPDVVAARVALGPVLRRRRGRARSGTRAPPASSRATRPGAAAGRGAVAWSRPWSASTIVRRRCAASPATSTPSPDGHERPGRDQHDARPPAGSARRRERSARCRPPLPEDRLPGDVDEQRDPASTTPPTATSYPAAPAWRDRSPRVARFAACREPTISSDDRPEVAEERGRYQVETESPWN